MSLSKLATVDALPEAPTHAGSAQGMRWAAVDDLRGLSVIAMLLSLTPGAWEHAYGWLVHVKWEGWNLIDMVAPGFLFCVGIVMPAALRRRMSPPGRPKSDFQSAQHEGTSVNAGRSRVAGHVLARALALVLLGLVINAYPDFDLARLRLPGVLQRIGVSYALVGLYVLVASPSGPLLLISPTRMAAVAAAVLLSYWGLLYFVPVPGYGAPRFDPVGSWPAVVDRALFTVPHMFRWWPVDGKVVFDPDGLLSVYPTCALILLGVATATAWPAWQRPARNAIAAGVVLVALALALQGVCPIVKNIWTSTFVLFSGGVALMLLGVATLLQHQRPAQPLLFPLRVFGANPLLAYLLCFLIAPVLDANLIPHAIHGQVSLRWGSQLLLSALDPQLASLLFGVAYLAFLFPILLLAHQHRWFLKI